MALAINLAIHLLTAKQTKYNVVWRKTKENKVLKKMEERRENYKFFSNEKTHAENSQTDDKFKLYIPPILELVENFNFLQASDKKKRCNVKTTNKLLLLLGAYLSKCIFTQIQY